MLDSERHYILSVKDESSKLCYKLKSNIQTAIDTSLTMRQILLILPTDSLKGGAETVLHLIAKELATDSDTQITIAFLTARIYHGWDRLGELPNVSLIFTQSQSVWRGMPKLILNLIRLRGRKFDICFTSHTDMTGVAGLLKRLHQSIDLPNANDEGAVYPRSSSISQAYSSD